MINEIWGGAQKKKNEIWGKHSSPSDRTETTTELNMYLDAKLKEKHRVFAEVDATTHIHIGSPYLYTMRRCRLYWEMTHGHMVAALVGV